MLSNLALVCLGGAAGSGTRFLVASFVARSIGAALPWGTLAVNLLGSFAIELVLARLMGPGPLLNAGRLLFVTGFMGGFTTYSSFNHETVALLRSGNLSGAFIYAGFTALGALAFGLAGFALGRALWSSP